MILIYPCFVFQVCVMPFGKWNLRKLMQLGQRDNYIRYSDQMFEKLLDKMKGKTTPSGLPVSQFTILVDTDQLSMRTLACLRAIDVIMESMRRFEANHPGTKIIKNKTNLKIKIKTC